MFNFQAFVRRKWSEYSVSSGQKGTVIDELAVKPTGLVMADFNNALVQQRQVNNISEWKNMTDTQLNFFGSKFFFPRIDGDYTFGNVRIWFDEKKDITIGSNTRFVSEEGYRFEPSQPGYVSKNSFKISNDRWALYYINVPVIAVSKGNEFNIEAGQITHIEGIDFTYKAVSNPDDMLQGSKYESNEEYYTRLLYSLNDRSMMNKRSMFAKLPQLFPVVSSVYISGAGDFYMKRDLVSGIDVSISKKAVDYLGKVQGENMVKHIGFYGIYPPEVGSLQKEIWGPFSIKTLYDFPLTIEPTQSDFAVGPPIHEDDSTNASYSFVSGQTGDPGFQGYPLTQEMTDEMYNGLYFDDYKTYAEVITTDLFNIEDEDVGFDTVVSPGPEWIYGVHGLKTGNFGELEVEDGSDINVLAFNNNTITLSGGAQGSVSVAKDIQKRIGIKLTGTFIFPEYGTDEDNGEGDSDLQFMVGGINPEDNNYIVDGYTGIGFGVRFTKFYDDEDYEPNAIIYFAHSEKYGTAQVFAADDDLTTSTNGHISITDMGALAEKTWIIEPGAEYEFEFIIHDDLRMTLWINKIGSVGDVDNVETTFRFNLDSTILNVYSKELFNKSNEHYGTMMKITLDTPSESIDDQWIVSDLKAFDTQESRATALLAIDIKELESPASVYLRAFGSGSVNGTESNGYSAFIWDKESESVGSGTTELTNGAWVNLDGISNPTGSKDVLSRLISHDITNLERYRVNNRFGNNIFLLIASTGVSKSNSRFFNNINEDVQSYVRVDYVQVKSQSELLYHANNKSDIYVTTVKNSEDLESTSVVLTKQSTESYFTMNLDNDVKVPVESILSVTLGTVISEIDALSDTDYSIVRPDTDYRLSSQEEIRIVLNDIDADEITVEYTTYPEIERIQEFFDGTDYGKIYGDILIKHKFPVYLDFTIFFTGATSDDQVIDEIRKYVDENIDGVFSTRQLISYLYNENIVNNVQEPIEISYEKYDDEYNVETGTFTDTLEIRDIDFFRVRDLEVSRL